MILYEEVIFEAGTFKYSKSDKFVLHASEPWSTQNTKDDVLKRMQEIETRKEEGYITVIDGKTRAEKYKYRVEKKDEFVADYRTVDVISEFESESYGKEIDFIKYAYIIRKENHKNTISQNTSKDLTNKKFAEVARKVYGDIPMVGLLHHLNDSLALSHSFKMPIMVDALHAPLLRIKTEYELGLEFAILDRLAQMTIPDFSTLDLDSLLQLRKEKVIKSFRKLIWRINSQLQSEAAYSVDELFMQELLDEIKEMAPTTKEFILNTALGALSFIPEPVVNITTTILSVGKDFRKYRDFASNWLSFILKAKEVGGS